MSWSEEELVEVLKEVNHLELIGMDLSLHLDEIKKDLAGIDEFIVFDTSTADTLTNKHDEIPINDWHLRYLKNKDGNSFRHDYWLPEEYDWMPNKENLKQVHYAGKDWPVRWDDDVNEEDVWEFDLSNYRLTAGQLTQMWPHMRITEAGRECEYTCNFMEEVFGDTLRYGFSNLPGPNGRIYRHSHFAFHGGKITLPYLYQVVHIPLVTNKKARFIVFDDWDGNPRSQDVQHYPEGTAWNFNSFKYHAAINAENELRSHIIAYVWIPGNEKFKKILNDSLEKYFDEK